MATNTTTTTTTTDDQLAVLRKHVQEQVLDIMSMLHAITAGHAYLAAGRCHS